MATIGRERTATVTSMNKAKRLKLTPCSTGMVILEPQFPLAVWLTSRRVITLQGIIVPMSVKRVI
ncbi:Uncharacterised protein [Vibrio cholerae]|nr:Uncharacterised protein [Vibrio cholerae]